MAGNYQRPGGVQGGLTLEQLAQLINRQRQPELIADPGRTFGAQGGGMPNGPQINFLGGLPFPVNETPGNVQNGAILLQRLREALAGMGGQQGPGQGSQGQQPGIPGFPSPYPGFPGRTF